MDPVQRRTMATALTGIMIYDFMVLSVIKHSEQTIDSLLTLAEDLPFSTVEGKDRVQRIAASTPRERTN